MKKTISGVLLALTAVFALAGCKKGDKKGEKKTGVISFYCWNDEFKTRLNNLYDQVEKESGNKTYLKDGITIQWVQSPNQSAVYQSNLDEGLKNKGVDMFCFEADYATKYVKSDYVADMTELGIDQSNQYQYTKDIVTNAAGKIVGSSWQGTPGIIAYNVKVAKAVYGDSVTIEQMDAKLSKDFATFTATAAEVKAAGKKMMIGPDDWFRTYSNNMEAKMYDGSKISVDKQLFQWAKDTADFNDEGYIMSVASTYGLWGADWGPAQGGETALCVFSCPWFTDFCLNGNATPDANGDLGYRAVKGYKSWFWGGTWLTATKEAVANEGIKDDVKDIIAKMTTDADVLKKLAIKYGDFTNDKTAMTALAGSEEGNSKLFGGQNVTAIYAAAVEKADLSKASDYDQQICENFQNAFRSYFQGEATAAEAWAKFQEDLADATSIATIEKPSTVTLADDIEIA